MDCHRIFLVITMVFSALTGALLLEAHAAISGTERDALIALYNSTDGDNWTDNSGWKDGEHFAAPGTLIWRSRMRRLPWKEPLIRLRRTPTVIS